LTTAPRVKKKVGVHQPWVPLDLTEYEIRSIKAVAAGHANDAQQQAAIKTILEKFCAVYDQSFRPGIDGHRATDFAEGKRWVGNRILHTIKREIPSET
jgi:hypothetical protein